MYLTQECGQKWYLRRSWRYKKFRVLRLKGDEHILGWAFGPIMLFKRKNVK